MPEAPAPHWLVKVSGQAHGKGVLLTASMDEAAAEVDRYIRSGVEVIHVYRWPAVDWTPPPGWPHDPE